MTGQTSEILLLITNLCFVLCAYLTVSLVLILVNDNGCWTTWVDYCYRPTCQKRVTVKTGIFCGNYSFAQGIFPPCCEVYCAECYLPRGVKPFKICQTVDDNGVPLADKEEGRFVRARPGDMFMVPFQCKICHFRNIEKRKPHAR